MGSSMITRLIIASLFLWIIVFILISGPFLVKPAASEDQITARINRAIDELEELRRQNIELRLVVQALNGGKSVDGKASKLPPPPEDYEVYRRAAENDVRELWYFARAKLDQIHKHSKGVDLSEITNVRRGIYERQLSALAHLSKMKVNDGYEAWRIQEAESLKSVVLNSINALQNPSDCSSAKKVICNLNKGCGYGCQLHHATYCMIMAITMKRTLILKSVGWRYNPRGFEDVFQPVSNSCTKETGGSKARYPSDDEVVNIELPIIDAVIPRPSSLPLAVPKSLVPRLEQLHGNPALWWISQIVAFLQRPQKQTLDYLAEVQSQNGIPKPYVGIHVRRTDKIGTEAAFHGIDEYMSWASEYFDKYELIYGPLDKRRVYIASDDASVLKEARNQFPDYLFYGDQKISVSASVKNRYTVESLRGVIADIHMLSQSDYIVCTLSSQVCRVALELMQLRYPDASEYFHSLDDIFYFGGQKDHNEVAIQDHREENEIQFKKGDVLGIAGNHWDGYSKGVNRRTKQKGLYPSFKTKELVDAVDFGNFILEPTS